MKNARTVSLISFCVLVLIAVPCIFAVLTRGDSQNKDTQVQGVGTFAPNMSDEERRELFKSWAKEQDFFPSATEANEALPFKLRLPKSDLCGELKGIYLTKAERPEDREIYVYYGDEVNGIRIEVQKEPNPPDVEGFLKQEEEFFRLGVLKADKPPQHITVNGLPGWGGEPGYNVIDNEKAPRPGVVSWWDSGLRYTIYGTRGENGTSLDALLKIANSMYSE